MSESCAWLRDARNRGWRRFSDPVAVLTATKPSDVMPLLEKVRDAVKSGLSAAGFLSYEASPALDSACETHPHASTPAAWFMLVRDAPLGDAPPSAGGNLPGPVWTGDMGPEEHAEALREIRAEIARGQTYQVNLTYRLRSRFAGDPMRLFASLHERQEGPYAGLVLAPEFALLSMSPELFFSRRGERLTCRPMKGTLSRLPQADRDRKQARDLQADPKSRAENMMIVDMVRNDLGRIAEAGTVTARPVLNVEPYPNVWQLTSTVTAISSADIPDLFRALFPCASITGAPKIATMRVIRRLETSPRGIYTGALGFFLPDGNAQFNVLIRSVWMDRTRGTAEFGTGGGIVWDSREDDEYEECLRKAFILVHDGPLFHLLESLFWSPETGFTLLDRHLARLRRSARHFRFSCRRDRILVALEGAARNRTGAHKVRLLLDFTGRARADAEPLSKPSDAPIRLRLARRPIRSDDPFLRHKTTRRDAYDSALARVRDADDVLLWNERSECTETTRFNLLVRLDGAWVTPPVCCGLLPGTLREELLARGDIRERVIRVEDLRSAEVIEVINAVRGRLPAVLLSSAGL